MPLERGGVEVSDRRGNWIDERAGTSFDLGILLEINLGHTLLMVSDGLIDRRLMQTYE